MSGPSSMPRLRVLLVLVLALCSAAAATLAARQASRQAQPLRAAQPFQVAINHVEVNAVVTDRAGQFVRGLGKDDFEVFEDGKRQTLDAVRLVDLPVGSAPSSPPSAATPGTDVFSNDGAARGRVYVLVLDDLHTDARRSSKVRELARLFIDKYLQPDDVAAVVTTGSSSRTDQDFTSSRDLLLRAVEPFAGSKKPSRAFVIYQLGCFSL